MPASVMRKMLRGDLGFSLVETMVATFIFALVSASGVMILSGYQEGRLSLIDADERLAQIEIARSLIRADLLAAVERPVRDELGGKSASFEGGDHLPKGERMRLVRNGHLGALVNGKTSALERIEFRLENGEFLRRSYRRTDITPEPTTQDKVLLTGLNSVDIRFEADGTWTPVWDSGLSAGALPKLAEFKLVFAGGRILTMMFLVGRSV